MKVSLDLNDLDSYRLFLKIKSLPVYRFVGRDAIVPDEYAADLGVKNKPTKAAKYKPSAFLFDYQKGIAEVAIKKQKYAIFADCGLGKTLIFLEYIRYVSQVLPKSKCILMVCPLMVVKQTIAEAKKWYNCEIAIEQVSAKDLPYWTENSQGKIGITNFEAITDKVNQGNIGALIIDESSMLKSHYGAWGTRLIELGKGLDWKLAGTGTPAPNDRIEYANHAVFLDQFPNVNSFLAKYFVNRGETQNRWELKPHALNPFYRSLSHWSIFVSNPGVYGWKDNCGDLPPINVHIEDVDMTSDQWDKARESSGDLFGTLGGIGTRAKMARIAKGIDAESIKPQYIVDRVKSFGDESRIVWCRYNGEQEQLAEMMPDAGSIDGSTPQDERERIIAAFQNREILTLISKPKILGMGLNLQCCTRQIFSSLQDSYEEYYQAVKRSNRYGSTKPLNVHIPVTEIERPMIATVLAKAKRVQEDTEEQERLFKTIGGGIK